MELDRKTVIGKMGQDMWNRESTIYYTFRARLRSVFSTLIAVYLPFRRTRARTERGRS